MMRFNLKNSLLALFFLISIASQAQNGLNFQGVARNSNNVILASQPISLRLSIVQGTTNAVTEYTEVRKVTTNAQGLFNVVIGDTGTVSVVGNFSTIDWKLTPKFLKIEMDIAAGNNFSLIGTTQFQSVAYAQFASQVDAEKINGVLPVAKGGTGVASIAALKASLDIDTKVDKVTGKDLSTNDFTTVEKTKLAAITGTNTGDQDLSSYATNAAITLKENAANKSTATDLGASATSDILFPTQKAVKTYVDAQINSGGVADGGILTRHIANGAVTGSKLASEIDGYKKFLDGAGNVAISNTVSTDVDVNTGSLASGGLSNWQSFTAGLSGKLSAVEFQTVNPSSSGPAPIAYVEIYSGQGLSGTLLGTSANISISGMGRNWYSFDLNGTNIRIVAGSIYTARLVVNTTNQNYVYGDNAIYNGGISNISSTWDLNIKTKIKQFSNDPYLTTSVATGLYGGLVSNATHTGDVTGATALTITDAAVITSKIANGAVDLTTKVTGVLPTTNGGTGTVTNTANLFFATPNGASGAPSFRTIIASDLPSLTTSYISNNSSLPQTANFNITGNAIVGGTITVTTGVFTNTRTIGSATVGSLISAQDITVSGIKIGNGGGNLSTNASIGVDALKNNTNGGGNNAIGYRSLYSNTIGSYNFASGQESLYSNTEGNSNTAIGYLSLASNTRGSYNFASGQESLYSNTEGNSNTAMGYLSLFSNTRGSYNFAGGGLSLYSNTEGNSNTAMGYLSLFSNTIGSYNFASGQTSLYSNTEGNSNIAIGFEALRFNTTGSSNVALGIGTLHNNISGLDNIALGNSALFSLNSGDKNIAIGFMAGHFSTSGSNNLLLGNEAYTSTATTSNQIVLGNSSISSLRAQVTSITALSDRRDKTDIVTIAEGIDFIKQLKPVTFTWNTRDKAKVGIKSAGFIAQDLLALQKASLIGTNLDLVSEDNPEKLEARYSNLLPVMVKAIQDQQVIIEKQQVIIEDQKKRLEVIEKLVAELIKK